MLRNIAAKITNLIRLHKRIGRIVCDGLQDAGFSICRFFPGLSGKPEQRMQPRADLSFRLLRARRRDFEAVRVQRLCQANRRGATIGLGDVVLIVKGKIILIIRNCCLYDGGIFLQTQSAWTR